MGGSLAGLAAAAELNRVTSAEVTVFERSTGKLEGRGAGIVMQPETEVLLTLLDIDPNSVVVGLRERRMLHRFSPPRTFAQPQTMTAWDTLYRALRTATPNAEYLQGMSVAKVVPGDQGAELTFDDGSGSAWDLVIGADGIDSVTRRSIFDAAPTYSGYVAWRGLEREQDLPDDITAELSDRFTFFSSSGIQFLCYLVPGPDGQTQAGQRRVNWVWYVNSSEVAFHQIMLGASGRRYDYFLPPQDVTAENLRILHGLAEKSLPPLFTRLVSHSNPFLQPVMDVAAGHMRRGSVFLIGDAAGTVRPHTASGTSKSIADAALLAQVFRGWSAGEALPESQLRIWESRRLRSLHEIASVGIARAIGSQLGTADSALVWDRELGQ
ncbi:FAD binding domain-containing protein [Mycobacteroides abscessus]|uniref:FAD binding domain-containing protein n=1 Tax=Mycobacteroides abscessus TaxID=36809 RepID=UPI00210457B5|nr:FAD-dependent monooxygenase [Mycobacteroides abscessus]